MNILFWNTNNRFVIKYLIRSVATHSLDCIVLAEFNNESYRLLVSKAMKKYGFRTHLTPGCDKIFILAKKSMQVNLHRQDDHFSIFSTNGLIIGAVHFPSKLHTTIDRHRRISERTCEAIEEAETILGHKRSVILGDFNMNPFDEAMISFTGIRSTNVHSDIEKVITRDSEKRSIFYNPTWTFYDTYRTKPGTFYYLDPGSSVLNWHFLDQVLIRPGLIPNFSIDEYQILQSIERYSLLTRNGKPKPSDHLPLKFTLTRRDN